MCCNCLYLHDSLKKKKNTFDDGLQCMPTKTTDLQWAWPISNHVGKNAHASISDNPSVTGAFVRGQNLSFRPVHLCWAWLANLDLNHRMNRCTLHSLHVEGRLVAAEPDFPLYNLLFKIIPPPTPVPNVIIIELE